MAPGTALVIIIREVETSNWKKNGLNNAQFPAAINTNHNRAALPKKYPSIVKSLLYLL